ncbi:PAN domain-containing protein [Bradyrhizobium sp. HKCCYLR20261]|uniref:PAN domain-containing protein n=1 Tax=Bradyrhizobium sp. HKCCYLR20261 TaxID=3420760 RepID=UPI003EB7C0FE
MVQRWRAGRLIGAWRQAFVCLLAVACLTSAEAQTYSDRPGGDYMSAPIASGDPADCALLCEHDRRCRAWSFNYPTVMEAGAVCWLKNSVPARVPDNCCVSGVRGAGVVEVRNDAVETSIDRPGGDYRSFDIKTTDLKGGDKAEKAADKGGEKAADKKDEKAADAEEICKAACTGDNKCRAWTFARPGYAGKEAHCFLKKEIKPPRRRAGFTSGVVR